LKKRKEHPWKTEDNEDNGEEIIKTIVKMMKKKSDEDV
jgi:hypothetical protein